MRAAFVLNPSVDPGFSTFQPWLIETGSNGHEVGAQNGSALVGQPDILLDRYYAHVEVDTIGSADLAAFSGINVRRYRIGSAGAWYTYAGIGRGANCPLGSQAPPNKASGMNSRAAIPNPPQWVRWEP